MWTITKEFQGCYGHRVYTQQLDAELSCNSPCKCRHFHGHETRILVKLSSDELDERGMVHDFVDLNFIKKFIDDVIDHKLILCDKDPIIKHSFPLIDFNFDSANVISYTIDDIITDTIYDYKVTHQEVNLNHSNFSGADPFILETYGGITLVSFVPTSENLSKWMYDIVNWSLSNRLNPGVEVHSVEWFETPKSQSVYYGT